MNVNIMPELHQVMVKYLEHEHQRLEVGSECPACGTKIANTYSDSVANVLSESNDACYACGLQEEFAYGASRTMYDGGEVPGDLIIQQVMLGLLRKVFIHGKEWRPEESELMDVLLMKKQMSKDEFDKLQRDVLLMNQLDVVSVLMESNKLTEIRNMELQEEAVSLQTQLKRNGATI